MPFARTLRALDHVHASPMWIALALVLMLAWSWWLFASEVHVYAVSERARLEVARRMTRVAAPKTARVVSVSLDVGREVDGDDVLVELDASAERRRIEQLESEIEGLEVQARAVEAQIAAEERVRRSLDQVNSIERSRARIAAREAQEAVEHQKRLAEVARRLREREILSSVEAEEVQRKLAERSLAAQSAEEEIRRLSADRYYDEDVVLARVAELRSRQVELEAAAQTARQRLRASLAELERYTVRASARGRIGSTGGIRVGDVLSEGDLIATVIPAEGVHIAGEFVPSDAVGRIVPGQEAVVRMSGFSWLNHGALHATVSRVASEPSPEGRVRVELELGAPSATSVPLQHGLPGSVQVRVETVTPWTLLARMLGGSLTRGAPPIALPSELSSKQP